MNPLWICFFFVVFGGAMALIWKVLKEKHGSSEKYQKIIADFYHHATQMLERGERIEVYCGYFPCAAVTNQRLLVAEKTASRPSRFLRFGR